jgi:hypothetical protein
VVWERISLKFAVCHYVPELLVGTNKTTTQQQQMDMKGICALYVITVLIFAKGY